MTPAEIIADLDFALGENGTLVEFTREGQSSLTGVPATIRGYSAEELAAGIDQAARKAIVSPTSFAAWPSIPVEGDRVITASRTYRVQTVDAIEIAGVIVRIELEIMG